MYEIGGDQFGLVWIGDGPVRTGNVITIVDFLTVLYITLTFLHHSRSIFKRLLRYHYSPCVCVRVCDAEMTVSDAESETEQFRRQVIQLKAEYRSRRERLEALAAEYESSKKLNPTQRYPALKDMIKNVCTDPVHKSKPP